MKFCCAFNAAIKKLQNRKKKLNFFQNIVNKIAIFLKITMNYFQHRVEFMKNYENHVNFIF